MSSPARPPLDPARLLNGVRLGDLAPTPADGVFRVLWAADYPQLKSWNHLHVFDTFWRVYYNARPGNGFFFGREKFLLKPDSIVIVPANVVFDTFSGSRPVPHFCLHFTVSADVVYPNPRPLMLPADPGALAFIADLGRELRRKPKPVEITFCRHRSLALLHYLFASVLEHIAPVTAQRDEIARVIHALETNPLAFATSGEMAKFAGMSARNFQRHFLENLGRSPSLYLREVRLREAARQLAQTRLSIETIAENLGFSNRFHFSRVFRSFIGAPPASFRKDPFPGAHSIR